MFEKIGRNDPCPCGSGKKYKKCCMSKEQSGAPAVVESNLKSKDLWDDEENGFGEFDDFEDFDNRVAERSQERFMIDIMYALQKMVLDRKPHIKEYKKIRKLHGEIVGSMIDHYNEGKFEQKVDADYVSNYASEHKKDGGANDGTLILLECSFDFETQEGLHAFDDMLIYKTAPNINCITEEFIDKHRYRKPEKVEFLQSMLDSKLGLFEITGIEMEEGYVHIKEVFTGSEYKMTDIGLSGSRQYDDIYFYTRIITYRGVSFGTGFNLMFEKKDPFMKNYIKDNKKDFTPHGELRRFVELYNYYSKNTKGPRSVIKNV